LVKVSTKHLTPETVIVTLTRRLSDAKFHREAREIGLVLIVLADLPPDVSFGRCINLRTINAWLPATSDPRLILVWQ